MRIGRLNQGGAIDIILILVFLMLAAGLGGYVYYQQQQAGKTYNSTNGVTVSKHAVKRRVLSEPRASDYVNWKTYSNETYKFSFQYPADWRLNVVDQIKSGATIPLIETYSAWSPIANAGGFSMERNKESLVAGVSHVKAQCSLVNCKVVSQENVEKSGVAGVLVTTMNTTNNLTNETYVFNKHEYTFVVESGGGNSSQVEVITAQIFASLKFN